MSFAGLFIAHRGNLRGPNLLRENSPLYLDEALSQGFDCELDLWVVSGVMKLGHDDGQYPVDLEWLRNRQHKLWIHCKNHEAVALMAQSASMNWFFHETDAYTLTSKGYVWSFPGMPVVGSSSVILDFGRLDPTQNFELGGVHGICGDFVGEWSRTGGSKNKSRRLTKDLLPRKLDF